MYSLKKIPLEWIAVVATLFIIFILYTKYFQPQEGANGFYYIRPVMWEATPTSVEIMFISFHPSSLICTISSENLNSTISFEPRKPVYVKIKGSFVPNTFKTFDITIDCNSIKERGTLTVFVSTGS